MAEPYLSEIRIMGFNFAPRGWAQCDGQILPINQNQSLYSLLGTTYGGDGRSTFGLPDLRGRLPIHMSTTYRLGSKAGKEAEALQIGQIPQHNHTVQATDNNATGAAPAGTVLARATGTVYGPADNLVAMTKGLAVVGKNQGHDNMQPCLVVNFCIATTGLFPSRN